MTDEQPRRSAAISIGEEHEEGPTPYLAPGARSRGEMLEDLATLALVVEFYAGPPVSIALATTHRQRLGIRARRALRALRSIACAPAASMTPRAD